MVPTTGHPDGGRPRTRNGARKGDAARAVLRPLRRAAARSAGAVEDAAVRAAHRQRQGQRQGDRGARRGGQQGPAHDLPGGGARLEEGVGRAAARHHRAARGRGGVRLAVAAGLPRQARQGGDGRPGARVRHRPVGQGYAGHLDAAARACRPRGGHHRPQPRSAFGHLRRGGHEPDPRAGRASSARCTTPTARCACRASTTASASRRPSSSRSGQSLGFDASRVPGRCRPERAGRREALQRARADLGAADHASSTASPAAIRASAPRR